MCGKKLKSMLSVGVSFFMLFGMLAISTMAIGPGDNEENPILIKSKLDFEAFAQEVNNGESFKGKHIKLGSDICLTSGEILNGKPIKWEPIGFGFFNQKTGKISDNSKAFEGTFDGNGYSINCNICEFVKGEEAALNGAIFGYTGESAVLKNLSIRGIISGKKIEAGVTALCDVNCGTVDNCKIRATVDGVYGASGLSNFNLGKIKNCEVYGKVLSRDLNCAGVCATNVGEVDNCRVRALLVNCRNGGIEENNNYQSPNTGGITALNRGTVTNCTVDSYISNKNIETLKNYENYLEQKSDGQNAYIGCAGGIASKNNGLIENCKVLGSVKSYEAGGIVGINYETIKSCETKCNIFGAVVAGIAAQNIVGDKCYAGKPVVDHQGGCISDCNSNANIRTLFLAGEIVCTEYWNDTHATVENCTSSSEITHI